MRWASARARARAAVLCAVVLAGSGALAGCEKATSAKTGPAPDKVGTKPAAAVTADPAYAVDAPGPMKGMPLSADILVSAPDSLPADVMEAIGRLKYVAGVLPVSKSESSIEGRTLTVAAADPGQLRRWVPAETRAAQFVWDRIAGGEVAVDGTVSRKLVGKGDMLRLGTREDAPEVHVGAYAPLVQQSVALGRQGPLFQAVVNLKRGEQLGIPVDNALLVSTGTWTPSKVRATIKKLVADVPDATVETLALELKSRMQNAVLTGESVSQAVGTFTYTNGPDGTIKPDQRWVNEYIRRETVPIIGTVTCNKGMLPQLRGALTEIQATGLADKIHPDEYAGCYYPRYINRDPSYGLSLHSWGIAVDLNVPGNQRGTKGEMDRQVVAIFKKWGFAWGGDWNYTDPMHFEMNAVKRPG